MDLSEFKNSLTVSAPPPVSAPLRGLWWAAKGDWDRAHNVVQDDKTADAAWVHAYLHRVEGDLWNAGYWYGRAGRSAATNSLDTEWDEIVAELIGK
jgi:hypothetical protein